MAEEIRISKDFIEKELPLAPPTYVSVFLMTQALGEQATRAEVAEKLDILESDVWKAWQYWEQRHVSLHHKKEKEKAERERSWTHSSARPSYGAAEMAIYLHRDDVKTLFSMGEKQLGRSLSHRDMEILFGLYDWLGLPVDVISMLLTYCVSMDKRGMSYIEKVGISWAKEGIYTTDKATEFIEMRRTGFREIMRTFGQGSRLPSQAEEDFMKKWIGEYHLPMEIILAGCERTVLRIGRVSFPYADSILTGWHKEGVKTMADIERLDEAYTAKQKLEKAAGRQYQRPAQPRQNRFINYTQREWDYAELERLERQERDEW